MSELTHALTSAVDGQAAAERAFTCHRCLLQLLHWYSMLLRYLPLLSAAGSFGGSTALISAAEAVTDADLEPVALPSSPG